MDKVTRCFKVYFSYFGSSTNYYFIYYPGSLAWFSYFLEI